ncbi:MAG: glycosyltransferase [Treponema sp.]|nr:glycosyltransferase [Treponema sp.]
MKNEVRNKKLVCILNSNLKTFGGGEKLTAYVCKFFEDYFEGNVQIDIFAPYEKSYGEKERLPLTQEDLNRHFGMNLTKVREIPFASERNIFSSITRIRKIELFTRDYDFFVNLNFQSLERGFAKFNIYNCMFPPLIARTKNSIKYFVKRLLRWNFYKSYDTFVSISNFTDEWLKKYWPKVKNSTVIYPPVFNTADLEGRYDEVKKKNIILSVGRFFVEGHNKKQLEMVNFFVNNKDKFPGYEYHLVGNVQNVPGDLAYLDEIRKVASESKNIFIHENCPYEELLKLYKTAKIFWHATGYGIPEEREPEKMEHFGITTVEAMSYGAVPVVINKAGQKEIVEQDKSGFKWKTESECVEFTSKLINDDGLRRKMAEKAYTSLHAFSYESFYEKMKAVVEKKILQK